MSFDPSSISNAILITAAFTSAFLAALWLSLIFWTYRDIHNRTQDTLVVILAVMIVAILSLPGILIYLILRPPLSTEEEYQRTLEEEALLQSIEDISYCPSCGFRIQNDWIICPQCHNKLKKSCKKCQKLIELSWDICPYCAAQSENLESPTNPMDKALQSLSFETEE